MRPMETAILLKTLMTKASRQFVVLSSIRILPLPLPAPSPTSVIVLPIITNSSRRGGAGGGGGEPIDLCPLGAMPVALSTS